jgi:hypothetical protein
MTRISWSGVGDRIFQAGVDRGVLYVDNGPGVPWIGLVNVDQGQSGGQAKPVYMNGVKISNRMTPEEFEATIDAYTYPVEFERCDGTYLAQNGMRIKQQRRKGFGMSYRSLVGNDVSGLSHAYKLHVIYDLKAEPSDRGYRTLTDNSEPFTFSWKVSSRPSRISGFRPSGVFEFDSRDVPAELLQQLEDILYGNETTAPSLPTPGELMFLFDSYEDVVYDADSPYTPVFATYDAGNTTTPILETIDGGAL